MRRYVPLLIGGSALIAAACSDSSAPSAKHAKIDPGASVVDPSRLAALLIAPAPGTQVWQKSFVIPAAGGVVHVGDFYLAFPANAVCDPSTSGYGADAWDSACTPLGSDFTVNAMYWWENGRAYIDFLTEIRFDPSKQVVIGTKRPGAVNNADAANLFEIFFWTRQDGSKVDVDETVSDETLSTSANGHTGWIVRRIKHFSGWNLYSGAPCDDTVGDPDCVSDGGNGFSQ